MENNTIMQDREAHEFIGSYRYYRALFLLLLAAVAVFGYVTYRVNLEIERGHGLERETQAVEGSSR